MNAPDAQPLPSTQQPPAQADSAPKKRRVEIDRGRLSRLFLLGTWIIILGCYCVHENSLAVDDLARARPHDASQDAAIASAKEQFHVEIAENCNCGKGPESIRWSTLRLQTGISAPGDEMAKLHPEWETLREYAASHRLFFIPEQYRFSRLTNSTASTASPSPLLYGVLAIILFGGAISFGFYMLLIIFFGVGERQISNVTVILVYVTIIAHILLTYEQGGLFISPVGQVFTTIVAFLTAFAVTIPRKDTGAIRRLYIAAPCILLAGSVLAHLYVTIRYDEGLEFLLARLYQGQCSVFLGLALVWGVLSIWSRKWNQAIEFTIPPQSTTE
jgi:hypothetical protein